MQRKGGRARQEGMAGRDGIHQIREFRIFDASRRKEGKYGKKENRKKGGG